ncbi:MAG: glycoside hydrolase family 10 protein [Acholeplasmataceae bacterium]
MGGKIIKKYQVVLIFLAFLLLTTVNVKANDIKTIKVNENNLEVMVNPISFDGSIVTYEDITNKAVLYTPEWPFLQTNRSEDAVEYVAIKESDENYVITTKNTNQNEIPLNGLILSIPTIMEVDFNIGDIITTNNITLTTYEHAILSNKGVRIAFNSVNVLSKYNEFTYYNCLYGKTTGTNKFTDNEMIVKFNKETNQFEVVGVNMGSNNVIPDNGFVLTGNAKTKMNMLSDETLFSVGDTIELINIDFVKIEDIIERKFTAINGTRYQDYLVIYPSSSNPSLSTQQNIYGCEVAVDSNGIVVEKGTLVTIPERGFAVSGHGTNEKFVKYNIHLGSHVKYDISNKTITVTNNLIDQTLYSYQVELDFSVERVNTAKNGMYDVNNLARAEENLAIALTSIQAMETLQTKIHNTKTPDDIAEFIRYKKAVEPLFNEIYFDTLVSRRIESRGTWHRPFETSLLEIESTLDELKALNFTDVYLETYWYGYAIYKSKFVPYHILFKGITFGEHKDYLEAFISEAKKRNINVHAWVQNFYVGPTWYHSSIWEDNPDWWIVDINGNNVITGKPEKDEENLLFFDPANPEVRTLIQNVYKEIIEYDVTGLHLDYTRYPTGNEYPNYSTGYTEYAMNEFKELYDITGNIVELVKTDNQIYKKWNEYRLSIITSFVEEIHKIVRNKDGALILSIAVGPNAEYSKVNILQDWETWVKNGWIDSVEPMAYVKDVMLVISAVENAEKIVVPYAYLLPGIAPTYYRLPDINNATYTDAINKNGAHGSTIFETENFRKKANIHNVFSRGTYQNKSVSVQAPLDDILAMFIEDTLYKFDHIYIKNNVSTTEKRNNLEIRLNKLTEKKYHNPKDFYELYEALELLTLELVLYADGVAYERFMEDIKYFMEIIDIRITRYLINNGYWDLKKEFERPSVHGFNYPVIEEELIDPIVEEPRTKNKTGLIIGVCAGILALIGLGVFAGITIVKRRKTPKQAIK